MHRRRRLAWAFVFAALTAFILPFAQAGNAPEGYDAHQVVVDDKTLILVVPVRHCLVSREEMAELSSASGAGTAAYQEAGLLSFAPCDRLNDWKNGRADNLGFVAHYSLFPSHKNKDVTGSEAAEMKALCAMFRIVLKIPPYESEDGRSRFRSIDVFGETDRTCSVSQLFSFEAEEGRRHETYTVITAVVVSGKVLMLTVAEQLTGEESFAQLNERFGRITQALLRANAAAAP